jgi:hypothetical protein
VSSPLARGNKPKKGDPAAIEGEFATYRHIQGRSVMQAVIEFPIEQQAEFFAALGYPVPGQGIRVAVVRLQNPAPPGLSPKAPARAAGVPRGEESPTSSTHPSRASVSEEGAGEALERWAGPLPLPPERTAAKAELMRHLYASLSPEDRAVRDAGMMAKNHAFLHWLADRYPGSAFGEDEAARYIRSFCQVESRTELATDTAARERFFELKAKFEKESGRLAEVRG